MRERTNISQKPHHHPSAIANASKTQARNSKEPATTQAEEVWTRLKTGYDFELLAELGLKNVNMAVKDRRYSKLSSACTIDKLSRH